MHLRASLPREDEGQWPKTKKSETGIRSLKNRRKDSCCTYTLNKKDNTEVNFEINTNKHETLMQRNHGHGPYLLAKLLRDDEFFWTKKKK